MVRMIILLSMVALASCKTSKEASSQNDNTIIMGTPDMCDETVEINGLNFTLNTETWVNYMPPVPEDGRPASGTLTLRTEKGQKFKPTFKATHVWLYNDNNSDSWMTNELEAMKPHTLGGDEVVEMRWNFNNGPKWVEQNVTVVLRLVDDEGNEHLIKQPAVHIMRVE